MLIMKSWCIGWNRFCKVLVVANMAYGNDFFKVYEMLYLHSLMLK